MVLACVSLTLQRLLRDEQGNALALTALALPLLVGSAAMAVDTIQWATAKREAQATADAAAMAGVYGLIQGGDVEDAVDRSVAQSHDLDSRRTLLVDRSPDKFKNDPFAVRVRISVPAKLTFAGLFLRQAPIVSVEATATVIESGEFCAFALGDEDGPGIRIESGADLQMDCGIATNAGSKDAIDADGSASVVADLISAMGGISRDGIKSDRLRSFALRQKDPLEDTEPPLIPNTGCPNITANPDAAAVNGGALTLDPGCYGNLVVNGPMFLRDGEYILNRGSLLVGPTGELTCRACTIFVTSDDPSGSPGSIGKVKIDSHAKVKLAAPTQGPNAGLLIYQDRHAAGDHDAIENVIAGNSFSEYKGLIYFPGETLKVDGEFNPDLQCSRLVGQRLIFRGRVLIASGCSGSNIVNFKGTEVRLVG